VFVAVRGFQYAWPPLAYSIEDDDEASRLYSLVTTYYTLATGVVVCAVALVGRWLVRLLAAPHFFHAYEALPWLALGWALYGLYLVFLAIAGRARVTTRTLPAAALGLVVNVALLLALVPGGGAGLGISGAGLALCGAYAAMLVAMYALTRGLFRVGFEWVRLARIVGVLAAVAVSGELLLGTAGAPALLERVAWLALVPAGLACTGFFQQRELAAARSLVREASRRAAAFRARGGNVEAYAEDPLRDV
jgi:O-antigen/teichoic acid export membrane protein